jgi:signal transduction histidine kinase
VILLYAGIALVLLVLSGAGQVRLLRQVGQTFGGFFWALADGKVVFVSTPPQLPPLEFAATSLTSDAQIVAADRRQGVAGLVSVYQQARPGEPVIYTVLQHQHLSTFTRPAVQFTVEMWWQNYGLAFVAGISWLIVGGFLLATAAEWTRAVEGIALVPVAMLLLLYSHWGNVQQPDRPDLVIQFLWAPSFAWLGAAFIHLSLIYRPEAPGSPTPSWRVDGLPYLPLVGMLAFDGGAFILAGQVPTGINFLLGLGYGTVGGLVSLGIGLQALFHVWRVMPRGKRTGAPGASPIPAHPRHHHGDYLTLWIGGVGLGFCLGVFPILLDGEPLLPFPVYFLLAALYPLLLCYAIRVLRLVDRLQLTLDQREEALVQQQQTAEELLRSNRELQQATSHLLHADAHLRSLLSQRIHDQPKQQALRIRSWLVHWQEKLQRAGEREKGVAVGPVIEALVTARQMSEALEEDLRGLQRLVDDVYQRRSLGLRLHLEQVIWEDLPALHPEASLHVQADLAALAVLTPDLERTEEGIKLAEAISYTVTQALLNSYSHADASRATIRTRYREEVLEVSLSDDGCGFDPTTVSPEKTSLFKAHLKAREAGGSLTIQSVPRPQARHGTTLRLRVPVSPRMRHDATERLAEEEERETAHNQPP